MTRKHPARPARTALLPWGALQRRVRPHLDFSFTAGHEGGTVTPEFVDTCFNSGGSAALRAQSRRAGLVNNRLDRLGL